MRNSCLKESYKEIAQKPQDLAGVVVIFDSADGGMIAATHATLQQWSAGTLSDSALWHKCFFDPPEMFDSTALLGQPVASAPLTDERCVSLSNEQQFAFSLDFRKLIRVPMHSLST